jgi:hypothetical protein
MSIARVLLLLVLGQPALAQQAPQQTALLADGPDLAVAEAPYGMRFALGVSSQSLESRQSIFTSVYWSRAYEQRAQLEARFGLHLTHGFALDPYSLQLEPAAWHPPLGFMSDARWSAKPRAGFLFERENLLLQGDQLSIRANSDIQTLCREIGLFKSSEEVDALSLLGWRSHSQLLWQIGQPTREIQWQFIARFDRKAYTQTNTMAVSVLRRF